MIELMIVMVFVIGYLLIAMENKIGINKAATALLTAVICWALLVFKAGGAAGDIETVTGSFGHHLQQTAEIVFFLIGAMTIVQLMDTHGGFQVVTDRIRTKDKKKLLWIVSFITFTLSAVLGLLPTAIVMASLFPRMLADREDRLVFASMIIIAANAGGAWSPIGDVTTTMLWIGGQVSAFGLVGRVIVPSLVCMLVPLVYFSFGLKKGHLMSPERSGNVRQLGARRVFCLGLASLIFVPLFKILTGLPPVAGMLFGLGMMWLLTDVMHKECRDHLKVPMAFSRIDLSSVLFFLGILLAIAALDSSGVLKALEAWMDHYFGNLDIIATIIGLTSAIVDNVPLTAATMGMYDLSRYPMDSKLWELLAYSVGTGGSILIIGSAAGVVVMGMEKINFFWYLRRVSLPAMLGYFAGIAVYMGIYQVMP